MRSWEQAPMPCCDSPCSRLCLPFACCACCGGHSVSHGCMGHTCPWVGTGPCHILLEGRGLSPIHRVVAHNNRLRKLWHAQTSHQIRSRHARGSSHPCSLKRPGSCAATIRLRPCPHTPLRSPCTRCMGARGLHAPSVPSSPCAGGMLRYLRNLHAHTRDTHWGHPLHFSAAASNFALTTPCAGQLTLLGSPWVYMPPLTHPSTCCRGSR